MLNLWNGNGIKLNDLQILDTLKDMNTSRKSKYNVESNNIYNDTKYLNIINPKLIDKLSSEFKEKSGLLLLVS